MADGLMIACIALGGNLGRREAAVLAAMRLIESTGAARMIGASGLYESEAVGMASAPPFINAVAKVEPLLSPEDLILRLQSIETRMGRRSGHNESRVIDLDLISFSDEIRTTPELTLPHPRYSERAFVLIPLAEVFPQFRCPATGRDIGAMVGRVDRRSVGAVSNRYLLTGSTS